MAEEEEDQQEEQAPAPPPKKPGSVLRFLPIVILVLLLQFGGAWYYVEYVLFETEAATQRSETGDDVRPRVFPEGDEPEAAVTLDEFRVNPRDTGARLIVNAEVTLTVGPEGAKEEIESDLVTDRVRDAVIWELGNATAEDLRDSEGRAMVKQRIKDRINDFLYQGQVMEVWFGKLTLQALAGYKER